ncbi:MAG: HlyC/CorC family transporter [Desulfobacterales bacterium]|uniref:HlyC/CorC family transporter n=1 Tax=Candidatus Desulfatibia profunda TaxID=2841695 RepID=A0A8J6NPB8_9BACT|nr:HlyC/CorC family transporter [Candidatus Desulfatibia profunda]MBL7180718.1 HlyC/CorC family transporter [Desulfobacterales bacterium]
MVNQVVALLALLVLSGFFSSAETALFSISKTKARHLAKKKGKTYQLIKKMKDDPHRLLATVLIGNNVVNVAAAALATTVAINIFPNHAVGVATGIMTFLILVFGEVLPKSVATRNNVLIATIIIYPIYWLSILLYPAVIFLNFIPKLTGKIKKTPAVTEEELMTFLEVVEEEGEIKEEEKNLIHKIFEFDDTNASEIMTPRADMFVLEVNEPLRLNELVESGFTRIPIIEGNIDNVIGIINIKDLFLRQATSGQEINIRQIMTKPYFVPENKKLDKLLHQFKKRKHHMGIVVDEHGGVSGLITLEDALEEIVGEIRDESDKEEPYIVERRNREWTVPGKSDIDDVNEALGMNIPEEKEYDTFSGYVLYTIGRIPEEKEKITIGSYEITVEEKDGNRIKKYSVKQLS